MNAPDPSSNRSPPGPPVGVRAPAGAARVAAVPGMVAVALAVVLAVVLPTGANGANGTTGATGATGATAANLGPAGAPASAAADSLQVLHWWTSASERKAADLLAARLADDGVTWSDAAIPGGAGLGAGKVLRSRVLARQAPEATQIIGVSIQDWAGMGLLLELDDVAAAGGWQRVLIPEVQRLIVHGGHVVAAPLGVHRINTLFYNRRVFARLRLRPPASWGELEHVARQLAAAGVTPLAQSSEPWQVATLFENLLLAEGGPALHRALFVRQSEDALADPRTAEALRKLRATKAWIAAPAEERPWTDEVRQLARGEAAMLVMGDWAKGELNEAGAVLDDDYGCTTMPGTGAYHLYSVDTLTMFANDYSHQPAQEKLARLIVSPALQADYNAVKGSVPVRRDTDPARLDGCARASWLAFTSDPALLAPSLVHRMATDEASKDAIVAEIHRYYIDDAVTVAQCRTRLRAIFRALHQRDGAPRPPDVPPA